MKLNLQLFANNGTLTPDFDDKGYQGGMTVAEALLVGVLKKSWLEPGVTYTSHTLINSNQVNVPKISGTQGTVTGLQSNANYGITEQSMETLSIDKKFSGSFGGIFTLSQMADKNLEKAINSYKSNSMRNTFETYVHNELVTSGTESAIVRGSDNALTYLNKLVTEFKKNAQTDMQPSVALVSLDFYAELIDANIVRQTSTGDTVLISGAVDSILGFPIKSINYQTEDVVLYDAQALNIGRPGSKAVLGDDVLGGPEEVEGMSFAAGFVAIVEKNANTLSVATQVHGLFGTLIAEPLWVLKSKATTKVSK